MSDPLRLADSVLDCITRIEEVLAGGDSGFLTSRDLREIVLYNIRVVTESTLRLQPELAETHPGFDWPGIRGFRNALVHEYLDLNLLEILDIIREDLPVLKAGMIQAREQWAR